MANNKQPVRSLTGYEPPTPAQIKQARKAAGCTAREAATLVCVPTRHWQDAEQGKVKLHPGLARLFAILTAEKK